MSFVYNMAVKLALEVSLILNENYILLSVKQGNKAKQFQNEEKATVLEKLHYMKIVLTKFSFYLKLNLQSFKSLIKKIIIVEVVDDAPQFCI